MGAQHARVERAHAHHVGETDDQLLGGEIGHPLADRMAMLAVQSKETELRLYLEKIDIPTLLKMRAG